MSGKKNKIKRKKEMRIVDIHVTIGYKDENGIPCFITKEIIYGIPYQGLVDCSDKNMLVSTTLGQEGKYDIIRSKIPPHISESQTYVTRDIQDPIINNLLEEEEYE